MISENLKKPLACWRGKERYNGGTVECLTIIFESGGMFMGAVQDVQLPARAVPGAVLRRTCLPSARPAWMGTIAVQP